MRFAAPLTRLDLPTAGHHDLFTVGGTELWDKVYEFLDSSVKPEQQEAAAR